MIATLTDWSLALCTGNPDMWSADSWTKRAYAAHVCGHCPVRRECAEELAETPAALLIGVVVAGVPHGSQGKPIMWGMASVPRKIKCGWCYAAVAAPRSEERS